MKKLIIGVILLAIGLGFGIGLSSGGKATAKGAFHHDEINRNLNNQQRLVDQLPSPVLQYSNERANLIKRYSDFNDPNKLGYIYEFSNDGKILDYSDVKGKVTALSSNLDPLDRVTCPYNGDGCGTVGMSEPDGSYGTNGDGVFFFDTHGVYHEMRGGIIIYTDQPRSLTQQPALVVTAQAQTNGK